MEARTKEKSKRELHMAKASKNGVMEPRTKENSKMVQQMVPVFIPIQKVS